LFELSPATAFKGIAAGKECSAQVNIDDKVWNKNDQPEGFYLVWDVAPSKGYDIKRLSTKLETNGTLTSDFAATVYQRNAVINRGAIVGLPKVFPTPLNYQEKAGNFDHFCSILYRQYLPAHCILYQLQYL